MIARDKYLSLFGQEPSRAYLSNAPVLGRILALLSKILKQPRKALQGQTL